MDVVDESASAKVVTHECVCMKVLCVVQCCVTVCHMIHTSGCIQSRALVHVCMGFSVS